MSALLPTPSSPRLSPRRRPGSRPRVGLARWGVVGALVAVLLGVAGCGSSEADDRAAPLANTVTTATAAAATEVPLGEATTTTSMPAPKVLVLGDSGMDDAAPAILAMFRATGAPVVDGTKGGLGLTRLGFEQDWSPFVEEWTHLVEANDPDLSVVMLGVWDGGWVEAHGEDAYAELVEQAISILTSRGGRVLWLGTLPEPGRLDHAPDPVFAAVAARHPGQVVFADIDAALQAPDGRITPSYVTSDGETVQLRKSDGWHLCPDGAARVAAEVERLVVEHRLGPPAVDGWQDGPWRQSPQYARFPECAR